MDITELVAEPQIVAVTLDSEGLLAVNDNKPVTIWMEDRFPYDVYYAYGQAWDKYNEDKDLSHLRDFALPLVLDKDGNQVFVGKRNTKRLSLLNAIAMGVIVEMGKYLGVSKTEQAEDSES